MAITVNNGAAAATNGAAATVAPAAVTFVASGRVLVGVVLLDNTKSVSSITNTGVAATWTAVAAYNVAATLRVELWQSTNIASGSKTITANLSGSVAAAAAVQQYTGDLGSFGANPTATRTDVLPESSQLTVGDGDYIVSILGWNGASTDTNAQRDGTRRVNAVGAAGAAGIALCDGTVRGPATLKNSIALSVSRQWGSIAIGLSASATVISWELQGVYATQCVMQTGYYYQPPAPSTGARQIFPTGRS